MKDNNLKYLFKAVICRLQKKVQKLERFPQRLQMVIVYESQAASDRWRVFTHTLRLPRNNHNSFNMNNFCLLLTISSLTDRCRFSPITWLIISVTITVTSNGIYRSRCLYVYRKPIYAIKHCAVM